ncbi:MAG: cell envelope integrity protein CreD [Sulfuricella sp.]|nr:cell envelope integrity protein CreD [Sulfuricella sp.]
MQKSLFIKVGIILLLAAIINVPLGMVRSLVGERMARQNEVVANVATSYADPQYITSPILVLPYTEEYSETAPPGSTNNTAQEKRLRVRSARYILAKEMDASGQINTDEKHRGLFRVPVYTLDSNWKGRFEIPASLDVPRHGSNSRLTWEQPFISMAVTDPRGFAGIPNLTVNGEKKTVSQGSGIEFLPGGIHALVENIAAGQKQTLDFTLTLKLRGTSQLKVAPLADSLRAEFASNWPHPGFEGRFLPNPDSQKVGDNGFRAYWEISSLATNAHIRLEQAMEKPMNCSNGTCLANFEIRLLEPVNIYLQSERALKYGFLLIIVAFAAFFLFEILKNLAIHPAQYTLVGLALAIFFLLLLSLSEHVAFAIAYAISASACILLIGFYLGHVLGGPWRALGFSALLSAFYAALYALLVSEDNALLMGSLLLFFLLAAAMIATRRVDWYRLGLAPKIE